MADKVVSLKGAPIVSPGEVDPEVVASLEEILELAKSGQIRGFACALLFFEDTTSYRLAGRQKRATVGVLEMMKFRMLHDDMKEDE